MITGFLYTVFIIASAASVVYLTFRFRLNPFYILIPASFILGMISGVSPANTVAAIRYGFGSTTGYYGIFIIAGTAIAVIMEKTGAVNTIANSILKYSGEKDAPAALAVTGSVLTIPAPAESGFILFAPIGKFLEMEKRKQTGTYTIALAAGIYIVHSLIPPSTAPLVAAGILNGSIWKIFLLGAVASAVGIAASLLWCKTFIHGNGDITGQLSERIHIMEKDLPSLRISLLPVAAPLVFFALKSFSSKASHPLGNGKIAGLLDFFGDPSVAILTGLFISLSLLKGKHLGKKFSDWATESIDRSARLLIMAGAGGAFGAVLKATPLTKAVSDNFVFTGMGLLLPFLISAAIKTISGSSTVAIITASSVTATFAASAGLDPAFAVASIAAGSMIVSHANDPYFWIVSQISGVTTKDTYRFFTPATAVAGVVSFAFILVISLVF